MILTDQGNEFLKFHEIEKSVSGYGIRTKIFYCEAAKPTQKCEIENIHILLRRFFPKGANLESVTQEEINYTISNINSLYKSKYNKKTPNEMFEERYSKTTFNKLSIWSIPNDKVELKNLLY